jgi:hypothetical protein
MAPVDEKLATASTIGDRLERESGYSETFHRTRAMFPLAFEPLTIVTWVILIAIPLLLWQFTLYVRRSTNQRSGTGLRPIAAYEAIRGMMGRAAEEGKGVHLSLGRSGVGGEQTPTVSAGLSVLRAIAEEGAAFDSAPTVTVADPIVLLAAQDTVYRAHQHRGSTAHFAETDVQLIAPDAIAYAVGAQDRIDDPRTGANVMVGHLDEEYLFLGEAGAQRKIVQVAGSNALSAQPFMLSTADHVLLGEEMYAAGAYLGRRPSQVASLYVQDTLRGLAVVAIVIGILVKTLA